jgi:hypothetical protein
MPTAPTPEYHVVLTSIGMVLGLAASALLVVSLIVVWRRGGRGLVLTSLTVLLTLNIGLSATAAVRLVGLTRGIDTALLALGIQFAAIAIALALLTTGLVRHRRRTSVR